MIQRRWSSWLSVLLWCVLASSTLACDSDPGGDSDTPVAITVGNLQGYWAVHHPASEDPESPLPLSAPWVMHFPKGTPDSEGFIPGLELSNTQDGWPRSYRLEDSTLLIRTQSSADSIGGERFTVLSMTASRVELKQEAGGLIHILKRIDSCHGAGAWWSLQIRLDAAAYSPDGQLHFLQGGHYNHSRKDLCLPVVRQAVDATRLAVSQDDKVLLAKVEQGFLLLQRFQAPKDLKTELEVEHIRLDMAPVYDAQVYDHLRVGHAGTIPVVLWANRDELHTFYESRGEWHYEVLPLEGVQQLTPTDIVLLSVGDELWVRRRGYAQVHVFDGQWRLETLPSHPTLGIPTVIDVDKQGELHAAFMQRRPNSALWDPLYVGHYDGVVWKTARVGFGSPWDMKVRPDGSYDVAIALMRDKQTLGYVRVNSLEPGDWETDYGPQDIGGAQGALNYINEAYSDSLFKQPWGVFSEDGAVLVGVGSESSLGYFEAMYRNPRLQKGPRHGDIRMKIEMTGEATTIRFPTLGLECDSSCEVDIPSHLMMPMELTSEGIVSVKTSRPNGMGYSAYEHMDDGTWAFLIEPDYGQLRSWVTLSLHADTPAVVDMDILEPEDVSSRPIAASAHEDSESLILLRAFGNEQPYHVLERYDASGQRTSELRLDIQDFAVGNMIRAVTPQEILTLNEDLTIRSRVPFTPPTPVHRVAVTPLHVIVVERDRLSIYSDSGLVEYPLELHELGIVKATDKLILISVEVQSYPQAFGDQEIPPHHHALLALGFDGQPKWSLSVPTSAFRHPVLSVQGKDLIWAVQQFQRYTPPAGSPLSGLKPIEAGALTHVVHIKTDGEMSILSGEASLMSKDDAILLQKDGVWLVASNAGAIHLSYLRSDGSVVKRSFDGWPAGHCFQTNCRLEPTLLTQWGEHATLVRHQQAHEIAIDGKVLPAILPPLWWKTVLMRLQPF